MEKSIKRLLLLCIVTVTSGALAQSRSEAEFIKQYLVDPEVAEILDNHHEEIDQVLRKAHESGRMQHTTWNFPWLSDYMVKLNIDRIYGMEKMQRCIDKFNLDLIMVPDKRIYHIKGRPSKLTSNNYLVVVKKIKTDPDRQPMSLRLIKQLVTLMKETEYISVTSSNYIRTFHGKIAMIDTESNFEIKKLLSGGYIRLIASGHDLSKDYTEEALKYILTEMAHELRKVRSDKYDALYSEIARYLKRAKHQRWDYLGFLESELAKVSTRTRAAFIHKTMYAR